MASHAPFPPSGLDALALCPGKWHAENEARAAGIVDEDSPASIDGTRRHLLAEWRVQNPEAPWPTTLLDDEKKVHSITSEDVELVASATQYLFTHPCLEDQVSGRRWLERKLEIGRFCNLPDDILTGTADVVLAGRYQYEIVDYKFGRFPVDPSDWLQGKAYAIGAGDLMDWAGIHQGLNRPQARVGLTIIQPFDTPMVKTQWYPVIDLADWAAHIGGLVKSAQDPNAPRIAGDKQCKWCLARTTCPVRLSGAATSMFEVVDGPTEVLSETSFEDEAPVETPAQSVGTMEGVMDEILAHPADAVTEDEIGRFLDLAPMLEGVIKDYRGRAKKTLESGGSIPGWKLVPGNKKREWISEDDSEIEAGLVKCGLKKSEIYPKVIPSVPKMAAVVKPMSKLKRERFREMYREIEGKPVLAPEGDKRPSLTESMFEKAEEVSPTTEQPEPTVTPQPEPTVTPQPEQPIDDDLLPDWMR